MHEINLKGEWFLNSGDNQYNLKGYLPGCNYLDLMSAGIIEDVFYGVNEHKSVWVAEKDWEYSRKFIVNEEFFNMDYVFLKISGGDTLIDIYINNNLIGKTENAHIDYRFDIKNCIHKGENSIRLFIHSPVNYIKQKHKEDPSPVNLMGISGFPHIRKPACHFGWDWGPVLPPSGVSSEIKIICYNKGYIDDLTVKQRFITFDKVELKVLCDTVKFQPDNDNYFMSITLKDEKGEVLFQNKNILNENRTVTLINIINPNLWTVNGGKDRKTQPLYNVECHLLYKETILDEKETDIGIREIKLDTEEDKYGKQFAFIVNGTRIFAKGGNWIPADSFITRKSDEEIEYFIKSCADANMNMIRVWGGGYYESDIFYRLCDKYGILVWQDFAFACQPYPFYNTDYLNNVKNEVKSVVKRLKNHACLCLWCGNNEIESMTFSWFFKRKIIKWTKNFFYDILPKWLAEMEIDTPYWYSSPSGGEFLKKINCDNSGDTHLWHVWHGLQPFDYYHKRFTRFCSEFGFESLPSIDTVKTFAEEKDFDLFSEPLLSHQKCRSGNDKIIYYMIDNYCIPQKFSQLIYVSQLVQAESIKAAVEHWRRNAGQCNGALFWQLNDCWPVLSWASVDYYGRWKALQYYSKRFFEPVHLNMAQYKNTCLFYIINDKEVPTECLLKLELIDFNGAVEMEEEVNLQIGANACRQVMLQLDKGYYKKYKNRYYIYGTLTDKDNRVLSRNTFFFNRTGKLELNKANIKAEIIKKDNYCEMTIESDTFAKNVFLRINGMVKPFSDNFFDLKGKEKRIVTFESNMDKYEIEQNLEILCYNNITPKYTKRKEKRIKRKIGMQPINILSKILYKFM